MIIHADESSKRVAGESWHSDVSCDPEPPMGSILRIHTLPETGGDTVFASMYAAFDALSEPMQRFLEGLTATHDGAPYYRSVNARIGRDDGGRSTRTPRTRSCARTPRAGARRSSSTPCSPPRIDGLSRRRERRAARVPVRPRPAAPVSVPLPLGAGLDRLLGQPLRAAPGDLGLLARDALGYRVTIKGDRPV